MKPETKIFKGILAYTLKLPENPSTRASFFLIQLHPREKLVEQNPRRNASNLCDLLIAALDGLEMIELKKELEKRFPKK